MMEGLLARDPQSILMFGFARTATGLRLERYAQNEDRAATHDNDGQVGGGVIVDGAPATMSARAPVGDLYQNLLDAGVPASLSNDAGGFVCNHVYFRTLEWLAKAPTGLKCLFVHVGDWSLSAGRQKIGQGALKLATELGRI